MDALQVMADAADLCCHTVLHHCHSPKLLRSLCDVVRTDKNSKIRLCCAKYLLQASLGLPGVNSNVVLYLRTGGKCGMLWACR